MDVLIGGCGSAGPTLAWWVTESTHSIALFEKAPELRTRGYIVDFWGRSRHAIRSQGPP